MHHAILYPSAGAPRLPPHAFFRYHSPVRSLAGVERLGITSVKVRPLPLSTCLPAVGQGALALEAREEDGLTRRIAATLSDPAATAAVAAERSFLRRLGGGCLAPAVGIPPSKCSASPRSGFHLRLPQR